MVMSSLANFGGIQVLPSPCTRIQKLARLKTLEIGVTDPVIRYLQKYKEAEY